MLHFLAKQYIYLAIVVTNNSMPIFAMKFYECDYLNYVLDIMYVRMISLAKIYTAHTESQRNLPAMLACRAVVQIMFW